MKTKFSGVLTLFMAFVVQLAFAQEKTITGTVTDAESGMPLAGVNIVIEGTTTGTQTDFDGNYSLQASAGETLVLTYIGYADQEITVGSDTNIDMTMSPSAAELDQVVVTAFGIERQKKSLGYAATIVESEELTKVSNPNPLGSLSGKIAGVDITIPARPGASSKVIIRGFGSLTGNQPLYVIDGTPINNSQFGNSSGSRNYDAGDGLSSVDPNSIESINVLKGGAATVLYGERASNGAIIITTKKGKTEKLKVDFVSSFEVSEVARVPHNQYKFGQGWGGKGYSSLATGPGASNENGSWGPKFNGKIRPWGSIYVDDDGVASQLLKPYVGLPDNIKDFYEFGNTFTNSIRISQGGEKTNFSVLYSDVNSDGIIPTSADRYRRNSVNINGGITGDILSVQVSANYIRKNQNIVASGQGDAAGQGSTMFQDLLQIPSDISVVDLKDYKNNIFNSPSYFFTPYSQNPYFLLNESKTKVIGDRFYGNVALSAKITDELTANAKIGGDVRNDAYKSYGAIVDYEPGSPQAAAGTRTVGGVTEQIFQRKLLDANFNLNYDTDLSDDFSLNALAGYNYSEQKGNSLAASITELGIPGYYELSNSSTTPVVVQGNYKEVVYGVFGRAVLGYMDRYFLTLTARNDFSSTLTPENNSYFYPSAALSAIVLDNNEHFLKLRGSWARVGKSANRYLTNTSLILGSADAYFGAIRSPLSGVNFYEYSSTLGNPDIKPELTDEIEFGFESHFFNNRVNLDVAVYNRQTDGLIISKTLPTSTGFRTNTGNFIDLRNRGIEASLNVVPVRNEDFQWDLTYTFYKNESEVTDIVGGATEQFLTSLYNVDFVAEKGKPLGVFKTNVPKRTDDGRYIVDPNTGYYEVESRQTVGTSERDFIMGLQNNVSYKNFTLSFSFDWKQGGEMYSYTDRLTNFTGNALATTYNDRNPFIIPNSVIENPDGTYSENTTPITYENVTNFHNASQNPAIEATHVIDKTFIRLRDLSISYRVDGKILDQIGLSSASVSLYGRNLFLWTPDENPYVDPEAGNLGNDLNGELGEFAANPSQRNYGLNLKLSF